MDENIIRLAKYEGTCIKDGTTWSGTIQGPNVPNHLSMNCPMGLYNGVHKVLQIEFFLLFVITQIEHSTRAI